MEFSLFKAFIRPNIAAKRRKGRSMPVYKAIIPARSGSKGLPNKNIINLDGQPLIAHSIKAALEANSVAETIVSSDGDEILRVSEQFGAVPLARPAELAQDTTPTDPVIKHTIEACGFSPSDVVVLLQPTSPLRTAAHVEQAIQEYSSGDCDGVVAVTEGKECPFKAFGVDRDGYLSGYFGTNAPFSRRQDFPEVFFANGAIYIFSVEAFRASGDRIPRERLKPYFMDAAASVDIDAQADLLIAESLLKGQG